MNDLHKRSAEAAQKVDELLHALAREGVAPNLAAAVSFAVGDPGGASGSASPRFVTQVFGESETRFDLASVTKPMAAVAFARLASRTARDLLRAPLGSLLEEARGTPSDDVPLELLWAHRAGLAAHLPLWLPSPARGLPFDAPARREALVRAASSRRDDCLGPSPAQGFAPLYSDLGYLLAGEAAARVASVGSAASLIAREIITPLGLERELGTAASLGAAGALDPVAPTEDVAFRDGLVRGIVHDENAFAFAGRGGAGHAGMFGTAGAVAAFGRSVLVDLASGVLPGWLVAERPGGTLRAGFDGKSPAGSSAGDRFGVHSFGHLGFTGTSLWIDPDARIVAVLLTNRVSPTRDNPRIRGARPRVNDALYGFALANRDRAR